MSTNSALPDRITAYLAGGGLFNPELANHDAVRDLLIDCRAVISSAPPDSQVSPDVPVSGAVRDVLSERERQKSVEGWSPSHDDEHEGGEMAHAAACYALAPVHLTKLAAHHHEWTGNARYDDSRLVPVGGMVAVPEHWPWDGCWWKPAERRRNLVKAAALLLAEIERLDRAASPKDQDGTR